MRNKKGISLIVLVITIIVMIILAAAVVVSLNNTGIIGKANTAVEATNKKQIEDLAALAWADAYMEGARTQEALEDAVLESLKDVDTSKYTIVVTEAGVSVKDGSSTNTPVTGWRIERTKDENGLITKAVVTDGTVEYEIGTTVNYMPDGVGDTSYKGGWKLLGVDEQGRLLIMSSDSITGTTLKLTGEDGYINGLTTIQNAVSSYKDGTIGVEVRSIKTSDIDKIFGFDPATFTGDKYLNMMIKLAAANGKTLTEAEALAELGFTQKEEMNILNNNLEVTYYWDGTEYPKYVYTINGKEMSGNLTTSHSSGFTYYDKTTNSFKTVAYTTTPGKIATLKNDTHLYYGPIETDENSNVYKMLFLKNDGATKSSYWLADTFSNYFFSVVVFGMRVVTSDMVYGMDVKGSHGSTWSPEYSLRAVVTLAKGATLTESTTTTGTYDIVMD